MSEKTLRIWIEAEYDRDMASAELRVAENRVLRLFENTIGTEYPTAIRSVEIFDKATKSLAQFIVDIGFEKEQKE